MKSFMELESIHVIPHFIEKVLNFYSFIKAYILSSINCLIGHTKGQQHKFYLWHNGVLVMQYKIKCR